MSFFFRLFAAAQHKTSAAQFGKGQTVGRRTFLQLRQQAEQRAFTDTQFFRDNDGRDIIVRVE